jgi:type IV pilus assembly protein PilM
MDFLPRTLGTRPRLAVEVRAEGVVAARAENATGPLMDVSRTALAEGVLEPGLKAGNVVDRPALIVAVKRVLEEIAGRGSGRDASLGRDVTVVVPDAAVRVLLLDFDQLPSKAAEALPVVRFRLKKLLPFEVDDAMVSYQVMSHEKNLVRVVAVAMPREVVDEYEGVVTAAGYLPGAVLPSTLAALAGLDEAQDAALVVNAGQRQVTTAIVKAGVLLLHRTLDLNADLNADLNVNGVVPQSGSDAASSWLDRDAQELQIGDDARFDAEASMQTQVLERQLMGDSQTTDGAGEISRAVSVAAAYFEDTLGVSPEQVLGAGSISAERLQGMLVQDGLEGLRVRELVDAGAIDASAVTSRVPRGWLAGVRGALKS